MKIRISYLELNETNTDHYCLSTSDIVRMYIDLRINTVHHRAFIQL